MKTILWIIPAECDKLYQQIHSYDETIPPIRLTYTQGSVYDQAIILNYDTYRWLKEINAIIVC